MLPRVCTAFKEGWIFGRAVGTDGTKTSIDYVRTSFKNGGNKKGNWSVLEIDLRPKW